MTRWLSYHHPHEAIRQKGTSSSSQNDMLTVCNEEYLRSWQKSPHSPMHQQEPRIYRN
ncbi:hypothetical protein BT93_F0407 [Corymbia citriodora subsp. variegata]|nr:hypothetical protein BT93_F0407 [Corymbia citriodora subsp. variegata]